MAGRNPPYFLNTEEDRGAIVAVVSFTTIVVSTLFTAIRLGVRQRQTAALGLDDALLVAANIVAIVQTVLVGASIQCGLGRHLDALSDVLLLDYYKFSYTSSILAILSMGLVKLSVLQLQRRICGREVMSFYTRVVYRTLAGVVMIWTLFSTLALAFQCGTVNLQIYEPGRCANGVLWYPITVANAVTDAALAFSLSPVILELSAETVIKIRVMILLGTRILVCIPTVVQVHSLVQNLTRVDQTRAMMMPVIMQQIIVNLSILTGALLGLHRFLANLITGRFSVEVREYTNKSEPRSKQSGTDSITGPSTGWGPFFGHNGFCSSPASGLRGCGEDRRVGSQEGSQDGILRITTCEVAFT